MFSDASAAKGASTSAIALELESNAVVAGSPEQLSEVRGTEYLRQRTLMRGNPFYRRQRADRPLNAACWQALLFHEDDHAREETLEEVEEVPDGGDGMSHTRE